MLYQHAELEPVLQCECIVSLSHECIKADFPVMAEITRKLAVNIRRQFSLLSLLQRILAAWLKISLSLLFAASKCYVAIRRQW